MYVGEVPLGAVVFHNRFGLGHVLKHSEKYVLAQFVNPVRQVRLAYNDRVAVWTQSEA